MPRNIIEYLREFDAFGLPEHSRITEEQEQAFIERTKKHIASVNKYGKLLGKEYISHDASKLTTLFDGYCYYSFPKDDLTEEEAHALDLVTFLHITQSPHHPEYWTDTNLHGFTRTNTNPHGIIDASKMPEEYLEEMVCDWMAMGDEFGNSALEWFNKVNGKRWFFTLAQQNYICDTIKKLEDLK